MEFDSKFIEERFGVSPDLILKALSNNRSADGYLLGAISELTFEQHARKQGFEVARIKEKPDGGNKGKNKLARGDFYIWKKDYPKGMGFVVECKSVKSNSEEYTLINDRLSVLKKKKKILNLLLGFSFNREAKVSNALKSSKKKYNLSKDKWEKAHPGDVYPPFVESPNNPGSGFPDLSIVWKSKQDLWDWVNNLDENLLSEKAFHSLEAPIRLIQTHMPTKREDNLGGTTTGPLASDFNIVCIDLFLRSKEHRFVFANSKCLVPQTAHPNNLRQNYNIDVLVQKDNFEPHAPVKPWYDSLNRCIEETHPELREIDETHLDNR